LKGFFPKSHLFFFFRDRKRKRGAWFLQEAWFFIQGLGKGSGDGGGGGGGACGVGLEGCHDTPLDGCLVFVYL
jgi:hypothetical protein